MVAFYTALGVFVATSVAIAVLNAFARNYTWVAVSLGILGAIFMLYGSVLLIIESRLALHAMISEMEFVSKVSRHYAGESSPTARSAVRSPGWGKKDRMQDRAGLRPDQHRASLARSAR